MIKILQFEIKLKTVEKLDKKSYFKFYIKNEMNLINVMSEFYAKVEYETWLKA